jgi:hypothetical protein
MGRLYMVLALFSIFWVLGSWVKPTITASLILILVLHDLIDIYVEYCATT